MYNPLCKVPCVPLTLCGSCPLNRKVIAVWQLDHLVVFDVAFFPANVVNRRVPIKQLVVIWQNRCEIERILPRVIAT